MGASDETFVVYVLLAVPLVVAASWSVHRHVAPLLFDLVDADEMVVAGIHRLVTAAHVLLAAAGAVYLAPSLPGHRGSPGALTSSLGGLLALLAVLHLGLLALFLRARKRRADRAFGPAPAVPRPRPVPPAQTVLISGATPPTVPMSPPVFTAPRAGLPPGQLVDSPAWTFPPPSGPRLAPPPYPPPWCTPPTSSDPWPPPRG